MFYVTAKVASQYCVFDSDDNSIGWVEKSVLESCISQGAQVQFGVLTLPASKCNFGRDGSNIFRDARYRLAGYNKYEMIGGGKKFKFSIDGEYMFFTIGIRVNMAEVGFRP